MGYHRRQVADEVISISVKKRAAAASLLVSEQPASPCSMHYCGYSYDLGRHHSGTKTHDGTPSQGTKCYRKR